MVTVLRFYPRLVITQTIFLEYKTWIVQQQILSITGIDSLLNANNLWDGSLRKAQFKVIVSALPGKMASIKVESMDSYELKVSPFPKPFNYYNFYTNGVGYYPVGTFSSNIDIYLPHRIRGAQLVTIVAHSNVCTEVMSRLFWLN